MTSYLWGYSSLKRGSKGQCLGKKAQKKEPTRGRCFVKKLGKFCFLSKTTDKIKLLILEY